MNASTIAEIHPEPQKVNPEPLEQFAARHAEQTEKEAYLKWKQWKAEREAAKRTPK